MTYLIYGKSNKVSRENNRGASLLMAIILIGIILVFAFSLLLVSYTLYASQNKKVSSLRCSEAANTLSVALEEELQDPDACDNSALWKYLRCNLLNDYDTWPYYDPKESSGHGKKEAYRYFDLYANTNYDAVDGFPGSLMLCIYWTPSDDTLKNMGSTSFLAKTMSERNNAKLYIEIIAESGNQSYTVTNEYLINVSPLDLTKEEDLKLSKKIKKITTDQYKSDASTGCIYNPYKYGTTDNNTIELDSNNYINVKERWDISFVSRK